MHGEYICIISESEGFLTSIFREFYNSTTSFEVLSGSLRIATKYELPELRQWTIARLVERWPKLELLPSLSRTVPTPHALAIAIAREVDVPELLPAAFYSLSVEKWREKCDGGDAHHVLSPEDLRRIILGREGLQALVDAFRSTFDEAGALGDHYACQSRLSRQWRTRLSTRQDSPLGLCILRELQEIVYEDVAGVCSEHLRMHRDLSRDRLRIVIASIPGLFCI
jgi:hypothetical protein